MKHLSMFSLFTIILVSNIALAIKREHLDLNGLWDKFKRDYHKRYSSHEEDLRRKHIFGRNLKRIAAHNAKFANGETTYRMGINKFADLTKEEMSKRMGLKPWRH